MNVLQFPLTRISISFIFGILFAHLVKPSPDLVFPLLFVSIIAFATAYFLFQKKDTRLVFYGILLYCIAFAVGLSTQIIHTDPYKKNHYTHFPTIFEQPHTFSITLRERLKKTAFNERYIAIIHSIDNTPCSGQILLNIRKNSLKKPLEIGARLHIQGRLSRNHSPKNPNQFDYGKYLENKQLFGQFYASLNEVQMDTVIEKNIWYYTSKLRNTIIHNLEKNNFNPSELHVAVALILGQQQDIDAKIVKDYQYAGAVHILSVSGFHIGLILIFMTFVLKPIPTTQKGNLLKLFIILLSLALFSVLAGLAPSVVRSATMFSFVAIGNHLKRSTNMYHTILVSMFLILLVQPYFLFDVGFQLSYLALFFIIWLQPLVSKMWCPKNKILKYVWDIITVSFAAQVGTLPLSLYYFHQFPGLFFITNIIVIPLIGVIMGLGILVMLLAVFDSVPLFLSKLFEGSLYFLNQIINKIASVDSCVITDISFDAVLLLGSYFLIFSTVFWFKKPQFNRLIVCLCAFIFIQTIFIYRLWHHSTQQEWLVFDSKKNTLIVEHQGSEVIGYTTTGDLKTTQQKNDINGYLVGNFCKLSGIKKLRNIVFFKNNKILIIDSLGIYPKQQPDILLLTQSPKINLDRLIQQIHPKIVVADASNYRTLKNRWKWTCLKQNVPFYNTSEKGFYRLD